MTGFLSPAVERALGPTRAALLAADLEKRVQDHVTALRAENTRHTAEVAELLRSYRERLDTIAAGKENHA